MDVPTKKSYKYCLVPSCSSTTTLYPSKRFISLPLAEPRRSTWLKAIKHFGKISGKTHHHICEDHFNLENDAENYTRLKFFPESRVLLKPDVVPNVLDSQPSTSEDAFIAQAPKEQRSSMRRAKQSLRRSLLSAQAMRTSSDTVTSLASLPRKRRKTSFSVANIKDCTSDTAYSSEQSSLNSDYPCEEPNTFCFVDCDEDTKSNITLIPDETPIEISRSPKDLSTPECHPSLKDISDCSGSEAPKKKESAQATLFDFEQPKKAVIDKETQTVFQNCSIGVTARPLIRSKFVQCDLGSKKANVADAGNSP